MNDDGLGVLNVDSVSVWAEGGRADVEVVDVHSFTAVEFDVKLRAVLDAQASDCEIAAHEEPNQLHAGDREIKVGMMKKLQ